MTLPGPFFEAINGILGMMFAFVVAWFLYDVWWVFRAYGLRPAFYREAAASIGCAVAFTGDFIIRIPIWWYRHQANDGLATKEAEAIVLTMVSIGVIVAIIGCACVIRHLSPDRLGYWPWLSAVVIALAFGIGAAV